MLRANKRRKDEGGGRSSFYSAPEATITPHGATHSTLRPWDHKRGAVVSKYSDDAERHPQTHNTAMRCSDAWILEGQRHTQCDIQCSTECLVPGHSVRCLTLRSLFPVIHCSLIC